MIAAQQIGLQQLAPSAALGSYVSSYCVYDFPAELHNQSILFLPEGIIEIVVQFAAGTQHTTSVAGSWQSRPQYFVGGLHTQAYLMRIREAGQAWGIRFRPAAFRHFTRLPVHHLKNLLVSPANIWGIEAEEWIIQLQTASTTEERWRITEAFLLRQLQPKQKGFATKQVMRLIEQSHGQCRVSELAQLACLSEAQFRVRFKEYFGVSPKVFLRLYRLHYARSQYQQQQALTDLAYHAGYFDQAHFTRDVQLITSMAPGKLFPLLA